MRLLFTISFRNLFRQKRRSILLGIAISFGVMILVIANSFAHGISEVLFNKIIVFMTGHVGIDFTYSRNKTRNIFYNHHFIDSTVQSKAKHVLKTCDENTGVFSRVIGNGKSDNLILVGMNLRRQISQEEMDDFMTNFTPIEGTIFDLISDTIENPGFISNERARFLNLKKGDVVRARFQDVFGQNQVARITIVGIFKPNNTFMQNPLILETKTLKNLLNYSENSCGNLSLVIKDPKKNARKLSDSIQAALNPSIALIHANIVSPTDSARVTILGYKTDSLSLAYLRSFFNKFESQALTMFDQKGVILFNSEQTGFSQSFRTPQTLHCRFIRHNDTAETSIPLTIANSCTTNEVFSKPVVLVNEKLFYEIFYEHWPRYDRSKDQLSALLKLNDSLFVNTLAKEWILAQRGRTTKDFEKQYRELSKQKSYATIISVGSLYEKASVILQMEAALNMITFIAVIILFLIILIGVINSLRMSVRERTREIGTMRAIGMQRNDVRNAFILETLMLSCIASLIGLGAGLGVMHLISMITIDLKDNPMSMFLVNKHLFFSPTSGAIIFFIVLIIILTIITSYFPARRAAKMSAVSALRHYE